MRIPDDSARFLVAVSALAAAFGREVDRAFLAAFELGLKDLPIEAIERAVESCIVNVRFMPTVAELRERAGVVSPKERAVIAWEALEKARRRFGYYSTVSFDDPVINAAVRNLGGWERVSELADDPENYRVWFRKEFERVYVALCSAGVSKEQAAPLIGYCDRMNVPAGHAPQKLITITTGLPALPNVAAVSVPSLPRPQFSLPRAPAEESRAP